jgi:hypothetical protein
MSRYDNERDRMEAQMPEHLRDLPLEVQVAVLYERVGNGNARITALSREVQGLRRALWSFVFSLIGGVVLFLFSVATGWIGPVHS